MPPLQNRKRELENNDDDQNDLKKKIKITRYDSFNKICELINRCSLIARVTFKNFIDSACKYRASAFGDTATALFGELKVNEIYEIRNFNVTLSNPKYNVHKNMYEMALKTDTTIIKFDGQCDIPEDTISYKTFEEFYSENVNDLIDVIGIISKVDDITNVTFQKNDVSKRDVTIKDIDDKVITLVFWRKRADDFAGKIKDVISVKGAKIYIYRGDQFLSIQGNSVVTFNDETNRFSKSLMDFVQAG
ncbi:replication protein A 70 kDa DNA-binding subunit-like [Phymastichus coffea]|uniref:replication protein A 70 kDa DNA-binding subunit-like n=1 Tax=Phymastichus coffea TaxID=108790 RepID=UPI00273BB29F|nr:replication protein A 70 kDa DNA-binding subunit-like [Phymastichus coffea]